MKDEIKEMNFSEMLFNRDERLLDYITNLQEEIEKLTAESTEWEERTYCWQGTSSNLQIKIDKAIRTLETLKGSARWERHLYEVDYLLNILNGDDKYE